MHCIANENTILIDSANTAYAKNNFETAISYYEKILSNRYEASEVYYNLGNAYYKTNKIALAILNYERALKLNPNDEDIKFNLKLANQKIIDKIDAIPQLFITEWKDGFINSFSEKDWSVFCIAFFTMGIILLAMYLSNRRLLIKQLCFWTALLFFILSTCTFFIARSQYLSAENKKEAVIISSSVNANSSPSESGTKVFVLHEGTKVSIVEINSDWVEIKLSNGNVGWIKTSDIILI